MSEQRRRTALVTGGADGIGWVTCRRLTQEGWQVIIADSDGRLATARQRESPGQLIAQKMDVRSADEVAAVFDFAERALGGLDLLVNNAGVQAHAPIEMMRWQNWEEVIDVNLNGAFRCLQAAGRLMLAQGGGTIVNIVSVAGERGAPRRAPYCASKAGLVALTKVAAVEWAGRGVRVNAVGPGYIDSPLLRAAISEGQLSEREVVDRIPAGRVGSAEEIAAVVLFLASEDASYLTGQVIWVDGGFLVDYGIRVQRDMAWSPDHHESSG